MKTDNQTAKLPRIGFTERGDASVDLSWADKVAAEQVDGAIAITKNITGTFMRKVIELHNAGKPVIVHAGCTGWGGSWLEPYTATPEAQLNGVRMLLEAHIPTVIRIDPIIPTPEGLERVEKVIELCKSIYLYYHQAPVGQAPINSVYGNLFGAYWGYDFSQATRLRISVLDEYAHVKKRIIAAGRAPFYEGNRFQATDEQLAAVCELLNRKLPYFDGGSGRFQVETCAEPRLVEINEELRAQDRAAKPDAEDMRPIIRQQGCISVADLAQMGFDASIAAHAATNPQKRKGCCCLTCKTELLANKRQCPHQCVYCYWRTPTER